MPFVSSVCDDGQWRYLIVFIMESVTTKWHAKLHLTIKKCPGRAFKEMHFNCRNEFRREIQCSRHTLFKCLGSVRYFNERSLLCSPRLHLFAQKYSKNSNIVKNCNHYKNVIYSYNANLNFQHHHTSSVSHDPSEIILI